jgi:TRAP-type uncharacterized transport system substrate-binding protein
MTTDTLPRTIFLAEQICGEGAHHHLQVDLAPKEFGALEALEEVDSASEINYALIVGGVTARSYSHVRSVTNVANEHLHLLVKPELAQKGIPGLQGRRIALGPPTTASYHICQDVLSFVGLFSTIERKSGEHALDQMTPQEALEELRRIESLEGPERVAAIARLPDAVMFFAPPPSQLARRLVTSLGYRLVPLPFAEAYGLDRLNPPTAEGIQIDRSMLTPGVIPAYTYGSNPPEPASDCPTIRVPLMLIARDDADPQAVFLLLQTIYESPLTTAFRPPPLTEQVSAFPLHAGMEHYLRRNDPLLTPEVAAKLGTLAGAMGAFLSGTIALYSFLRLRHLNHFEYYYREIGHIEMLARGIEEESKAATDPELLRATLLRRLTTMKCKALQDFADGGLKGEGLMAGIIALINDTRESLAEMVPVQGRTRKSLSEKGVRPPEAKGSDPFFG